MTKPESNDLLDAVHSGKICKTWNSNECGLLWERLWMWSPEGGYQAKTCASGLFSGGNTYSSAEAFAKRFIEDATEFRFSI